jgi:hypothetical protein
MSEDFDFNHFDWHKEIDSISYVYNDKELKIKITAQSTTKYIIIPNDIFNYILKVFKNNREGALDYIIDYSVKTVFKEVIENYCSWNQTFLKEKFSQILNDIDVKIEETDNFFKKFEKRD